MKTRVIRAFRTSFACNVLVLRVRRCVDQRLEMARLSLLMSPRPTLFQFFLLASWPRFFHTLLPCQCVSVSVSVLYLSLHGFRVFRCLFLVKVGVVGAAMFGHVAEVFYFLVTLCMMAKRNSPNGDTFHVLGQWTPALSYVHPGGEGDKMWWKTLFRGTLYRVTDHGFEESIRLM